MIHWQACLQGCSSNHRYCPVGLIPPAAQWFEEVRCDRTTQNSLKTTDEPPRTSSNHFAAWGIRPTGQFRVSSGWFDYIEPPRTTVMQGKHAYRAVLSEFWVVRPHRTSSNYPCGKVREIVRDARLRRGISR